jgi:hypothetical protein
VELYNSGSYFILDDLKISVHCMIDSYASWSTVVSTSVRHSVVLVFVSIPSAVARLASLFFCVRFEPE